MTIEPGLRPVYLRRVPVALWRESRVWFDGLIREFDIIAADTQDRIPREVLDFVADVRAQFSRFATGSNAVLAEASRRGEESVDVEMGLPDAAVSVARGLLEHIYAADRYCRQGELLTIALEDDVRRFVEWYLNEVADQIEGADPRPWPPGSGVSAE